VNESIPYAFENMRWEDVPEVMAIEQRSFTLPWSANTYRHELLDNQSAHYFVLRYRSDWAPSRAGWLSRLVRRPPPAAMKIIGFGGFWLIAGEAHISTIAVDTVWRGRGLGEYLLASMVEQAMALNADQVTLEVRIGNHVAQNLYRKYGFEITGKRLRYYQDNNEDAYLMTVAGVNSEGYRSRFEELSAAMKLRLAQGRATVRGAAAG
jgi:ribosomal-protein-alanine N-acetyltransferase